MSRHLMPHMVVLALGLCGNIDDVLLADTLEDAAAARELFAKGEKLFGEEAYLEAAAAFRRAHEISPHPKALANTGYCYEYADAHAKAVTVYREYMTAPFEKDPETVADIRNRLAVLAHVVGELHVECRPGECSVEVDGVLKGTTADGKLVVVMAPGKYSVAVRRNGELATGRTSRVEAGEKTYARFAFDRAAELSPSFGEATLTVADSNGRRTRSPAGWQIAFYGLTGGAVASGVVIAVFGSLTLKSIDDLEDSGYLDADAHSAARRNKTVTNASIGLAAALAGGAVAVKIIEIRSRRAEKYGPQLSLRVEVGPIVGLGGRF